jgi:DNA methylase
MNTAPPTIPFSSVIRSERVRKEYGDIPELALSLYEKGFIHPLCINHSNELIAGGRRSSAIEHLLTNKETFPADGSHPTMRGLLATGELAYGIHYTLRATDTIDELSELELVENIQRKNFSWQENVLAVRKIHLLKTRAFKLGQIPDERVWGQKQTGRLLGIAAGNVNYCLRIAAYLEDSDSPIWKLASLTEALQWEAKLELDKASLKLAEAVKSRASFLPTVTPMNADAPTSAAGFMSTFDPTSFQSGSDIGLDLSEFSPSEAKESTGSKFELVQSPEQEAEELVARLVHNFDILAFREKMGCGIVDHIITDPPFGIDMTMLAQGGGGGQKDIDRVAHTHDVDDNVSNFEPWMQACYDMLKEKGFCIWFCDIVHFQTLVELGFKIGFKVQRWPFHWIKTTSCMNQRAEYNFTKSIEHAIILRKGDARLVSAQSNNYWLGGMTAEDRAACPNHPFAKPAGLWQHLAKAVALPGSTIGDFFSGVGSGPRAFMLGGWVPLSCEIDPVHYSAQTHNLQQAYKQLKK